MQLEKQGHTKEALIEGCKNQDRGMQTLLFKKYYPILLALINRYIKNEDDSKEVLQEAFIKVFGRIGQLKDNKLFDAWIKRIVINQCFDQLKKNKKQQLQFSPVAAERLEERTDLGEEEEEEADRLADQVTLADVHDVLDELAEGYRAVFMMYAIDDLSHKEIAELLGTTESNSKSQYLRAKKAIKKLIIKKFDHAGKTY